jgi:hypothetical protein
MSTSGSSDFNQTRSDIISGALELVEVISPGDSPSADQTTSCVAALNRFVKSLQAESVKLWTTEWRAQTFFAGSEVTGSDSLIYTCIRSHVPSVLNEPVTGAEWPLYWELKGETGGTWAVSVSNNMDAAAAVDAGSGYVDFPITGHGITTAERLRVVDSINYDGDYEIVSIPNANTVRVAATYAAEIFAGTETANTVYTSIGEFLLPKDILAIDLASIRRDASDYKVVPMDWLDYFSLIDKSSTGLSAHRVLDYNLTPRVILYPPPSETDDVFHYLAIRKLEDFDSATDNPDFPVHWIEPLTFGLAYKLTFVFGNTQDKRKSLYAEFERVKEAAKEFDQRLVMAGEKVIHPSEAHK